jgi:catechol 2,3-dioxygenase-like lactoylglutathione lyase family enzyme
VTRTDRDSVSADSGRTVTTPPRRIVTETGDRDESSKHFAKRPFNQLAVRSPIRGLTDGYLDHFCFRVEPFDETGIRCKLEAHGIVVGPMQSRYGAEGEGPSIYVTDPEGNVVELKGPPSVV